MVNSVTLIFPHQLFQNHPALQKGREVYLVEEWLFFKQYNFHRQKLVLHRASMKFYQDWLQQKEYIVNYIETDVKGNDCRFLVASLAQQNIKHIHIAAVADNWLLQRLQSACTINQVTLHVYDSPNFLNTAQNTADYFSKKKTYFQTDFYINQRKKRNILLERDGTPTGFIRQIMGWREFIHLVYEREGVKQRSTNYWKFNRKIPKSFWTGETGIPPIDITIKKILKTGYCHHIERLMVLGNFMQLCEFDPDEVYRWFMEMFIDAYDWVMVPNVYGMTQFADGGMMITKPYISGSNYLMKMSDYDKGEWQSVWDGLFWRFMHVHRSFFLKNPRLGMLVNMYDKMPIEKQELHLINAVNFLAQLDSKTT